MDDSKIRQSESAKKNERMIKSGSAEIQPLAAYGISFILIWMGSHTCACPCTLILFWVWVVEITWTRSHNLGFKYLHHPVHSGSILRAWWHTLNGNWEQSIQTFSLHSFAVWINDFPLSVLYNQEIQLQNRYGSTIWMGNARNNSSKRKSKNRNLSESTTKEFRSRSDTKEFTRVRFTLVLIDLEKTNREKTRIAVMGM